MGACISKGGYLTDFHTQEERERDRGARRALVATGYDKFYIETSSAIRRFFNSDEQKKILSTMTTEEKYHNVLAKTKEYLGHKKEEHPRYNELLENKQPRSHANINDIAMSVSGKKYQ